MNHIYRVIFNQETGAFQAVSEIVKTSRKSHSSKGGHLPKILLTPLSVAVTLLSSQAFASPTGGQVTAGQAVINQTGTITNINQSSQNAAINWQSFNIGKNETVNFNQPNTQSVTLNRVIGNERSIIDGAMNANGKVFISNANGMLIGKDAKINVGSLVATTANISDDDLMNGRYQFTGEGAGSIENLGHISVPKGGVVALVAPIVKNGGTITAHEGNALLASAESFSITLPDNANFAYTLDKGTLQGLVDNGGAILADAGRVVLTAKGVDTVKKSLIKHSGNIEANTVQNKNGVIELLGDLDNSALNVSGSLKAEGKGDDKGGFIETSSAQLNFDDSAVISTKSETGQTGTWLIDPKDFTVAPSGGDITGAKVSEGLQSNNVTLKSRDGAKEGKGDVIINDEINWDKNTLTLNAENDIHINKTMNGSGTAKLALEYGQGTSDGGESDYYLDKNTPLKDRTVKVNLPEGKNFFVKKGSDGEMVVFDVIHKMPEIVKNADGEWESKFTTQNIAFGKDIDLSNTKKIKNFTGYTTLNNHSRIHGLGHVLTNFDININNDYNSSKKQYDIGLFNEISNELRDLGMDKSTISFKLSGGNVDKSNMKELLVRIGTFAGSSSANVHNIFSKNLNIDANGYFYATSGSGLGGLFGSSVNKIQNSFTIGNIQNKNTGLSIGGLTGESRGGIDSSFSEITILSESDYSRSAIGGLTGTLGGYFSAQDSHIISNSYAHSKIQSNEIPDADGSIQGVSISGGLVGVGYTGYGIQNSYSLADINSDTVGGLAGMLYYTGTINNSYSSGNLMGNYVSGISGAALGTTYINNSYSSSKLTLRSAGTDQEQKIGGITNNLDSVEITNSYFDKDINRSLPLANQAKTTKEMQQKSTFTDVGWDFDTVWRIQEGSDYPRLRVLTEGKIVVNPTNIGIKANDLNKVYDGKEIKNQSDLEKLNGWNRVGVTVLDKDGKTANIDLNDSSIFTGKLRFDGKGSNWQNARNAGKYTIVPTGLSGGQKYEIVYGNGILTIEPKKIELFGHKTFDNTTIVDAEKVFTKDHLEIPNNVVVGDDVRVTGVAHLPTKNIDPKSPRHYFSRDTFSLIGNDAKNYIISDGHGAVEVILVPKAISLTAVREEKVYDGNNTSTKKPFISNGELLGSDTISASQYFESADPRGRYNSVIIPKYEITDGNNGNNYEVYLVNAKGTVISLEEAKNLDLSSLKQVNDFYDWEKGLTNKHPINIRFNDKNVPIIELKKFSDTELKKLSLSEMEKIIKTIHDYNQYHRLPKDRFDIYNRHINLLHESKMREIESQIGGDPNFWTYVGGDPYFWKYSGKGILSKEGLVALSKLTMLSVDTAISITTAGKINKSSELGEWGAKIVALGEHPFYDVVKRFTEETTNRMDDTNNDANTIRNVFFGSTKLALGMPEYMGDLKPGTSDYNLMKKTGAVFDMLDATAKIIIYRIENKEANLSKDDVFALATFLVDGVKALLSIPEVQEKLSKAAGINVLIEYGNTLNEAHKVGKKYGEHIGDLMEKDIKEIDQKYISLVNELREIQLREIIKHNQGSSLMDK